MNEEKKKHKKARVRKRLFFYFKLVSNMCVHTGKLKNTIDNIGINYIIIIL